MGNNEIITLISLDYPFILVMQVMCRNNKSAFSPIVVCCNKKDKWNPPSTIFLALHYDYPSFLATTGRGSKY